MNRTHAANLLAATAIAGLFLARGIPTAVPLIGLLALAIQNFILAPGARVLAEWPAAILHAILALAAIFLAAMHQPRLDLLVVLLGCAVPFLALTAFVKRTVFQEFRIILVSILLAIGAAALAGGWGPFWITAAVLLVACQTLPLLLRPVADDRAGTRVRLLTPPGWWGAAPRLTNHHLGLAGLVAGAALYLFIPRPAQLEPDDDPRVNLGADRAPSGGSGLRIDGTSTIGFPENIELGDITGIRARPGIVLRATYLNRGRAFQPRGSESHLYLLRHAAWITYEPEAGRWFPAATTARTLTDGWVERRAEAPYEIRIHYAQTGETRLFVPSNPKRIRTLGPVVREMHGSFVASEPPSRYRVECGAAAFSAAELAAVRPARGMPGLLRVPSSVRTLLRSIPAPRDRTIGGAVAAIRGYFDEFEYTTQPKTGRRPLATFLTTRRGHCELFATVACLYFRVWNIPSRIAGGVRCDEVVDAARGMMQARFRDAHAWVEIATRTRGFAPVDVTPPDRNSDAGGPRLGAREGRRGGAGTGLDGGLDWRDPFSYDARQRSALLRGATAVLTSPIVIFLLTGMLGLVLAAAAVAALRRRERPNRIRAPAGVSRRTLAFYAHFLNECAHAGFRRSVAQTPREFLRSLPAELNQKGRAITQEFERRRYGSPTA